MIGERLMTITRFETFDQAEYYVDRLEHEGIAVRVVDESTQAEYVRDALPGMAGPVLVQVPETDAAQAGQILEEELDEFLGDNPALR